MSFKFEDPVTLIKHLKEGNENAYVYLVKTYHNLLFNYALGLTNDRAMAQDLLQEVFLDIWENREKLNVNYSLKRYIYKMIYNKFINQYHKNKALSLLEQVYMEGINEAIDDKNADVLKQKINIVAKNIDLLPTKCKQTFLLSKKEGLTNLEIADHLDLSIKTVEGHLTQAYRLLRKSIGSQIKNIFILLFNKRKRINSLS